jgi:hypothetical protein
MSKLHAPKAQKDYSLGLAYAALCVEVPVEESVGEIGEAPSEPV